MTRRLSIRTAGVIVAALAMVCGIAIASAPALGSFLVSGEEPGRADLVLVLAGDPRGDRILKGAELVRQGFAPKLLASGYRDFYEVSEADLAINLAVKKGYPRELFEPLSHDGKSTWEEALCARQWIDSHSVAKFLVVTSDFHTNRTRRVFSRLFPRERFRVVAATSAAFKPEEWWKTREGRKTFFMEWAKTFADWLGGL